MVDSPLSIRFAEGTVTAAPAKLAPRPALVTPAAAPAATAAGTASTAAAGTAVATAAGAAAPVYGRRATDRPGAADSAPTGRRSDDRGVAVRESTIRVDTARLDQVLNLSGEIGLTKNRLTSLRADILQGRNDADTLHALDQAVSQLDLLVSDLQVTTITTAS